jgi:phenol 2-monooxygenase
LHQGRIERFFLDSLKKYSDIEVERGVLPVELDIDHSKSEDYDAYPITIKLRHLGDDEATPFQHSTNVSDGLFRSSLAKDDTDDLIRKSKGKEGTTETVRAKYMIGCDGAHSWTRRQLGFQMEGEQTDFIWGVLDIIPITNFPDIRLRCAIHSVESGSVMVIPRENKLVRLYIQLTEVSSTGQQADRSTITPDIILKAAQKIMSPYKLSYDYCDWWTAYQIGQRVGNKFSCDDRIFLAGDAVHTHSPKAGQGMNVSMQDTYNLGWKIGLVVNGIAKRSVLKTYQSERRRIAQDLIAFDHRFSRLFSGRPAKDAADEVGISMSEFKDAFEKGNMFGSGLAVDYGASILVAKAGDSADQGDGTDVRPLLNGHTNGVGNLVGKEDLASNIKMGKRFPSFQVLNQADARPWHFAHFLKSDGRFRIIIFAGNLKDTQQFERVQTFGEKLAKPDSFIKQYTPPTKPIDSVIEILIIHSAPRCEVELLDLHETFHPFDEKYG